MRNIVVVTILSSLTGITLAFQPSVTNPIIAISNRHGGATSLQAQSTRRQIIDTTLVTAASLIATTINPLEANAAAAVQDSLGIDNFLRTGVDGKFYIVFLRLLCTSYAHIILCSYHMLILYHRRW